MEDVMMLQGVGSARGGVSVNGAQLPLSFLGTGHTARIAKVRGRGELHHHLESLGFVEGASVTVVSEQAGNLIVEIKGAHIALDKQVATRIITA